MSEPTATAPSRHGVKELCSLADLGEGVVREVSIGARRFGATRSGDAVFVFAPSCPHRGAPLARGRVRPLATADCHGNLGVDAERVVVTCPWHNWEFDLATGDALFDPKRKLRLFPSEIRDGRVYVRV